jgi:CubicO group peptidase (beta-lactamase class C family)
LENRLVRLKKHPFVVSVLLLAACAWAEPSQLLREFTDEDAANWKMATTALLTPDGQETKSADSQSAPIALSRKLDELAYSEMQRGFAGALLVARNGEVLHAKGYGYADMEWKIPNSAQTRFRIASLTKSLVAVSVLQLYEKSKLGLEDSICRYIDSCPTSWKAVTIRHLLSNSSGIANHFWGTEPDAQVAMSCEKILARMRAKPLEFAPGTKFDYGNSGWYLLGIVLEKVTGKKYDEVLREQIFTPLGMNDTGHDDRELIVERRARGYARTWPDRELRNARLDDVSWVIAAASLYSTVDDLYKFSRALDGTSLLSERSKQLMWTSLDLPTAGDEGSPGPYGLGWWVIPSAKGEPPKVRGTGGMAGFTSALFRYPEARLTVIMLENSSSPPPGILGGLDAILFGSPDS